MGHTNFLVKVGLTWVQDLGSFPKSKPSQCLHLHLHPHPETESGSVWFADADAGETATHAELCGPSFRYKGR
jgi:hypothetical protein